MTFRSCSSQITKNELQDRLSVTYPEGSDYSFVRKAINVKMLDLRWFLKDGQFADLAKILESAKDSSTFETKFITSVMEEFWEPD